MTTIADPSDRVLGADQLVPADEQSPRTFASLGVDPSLVKALAEQGITTTFAIQAMTVADALAGRDVCGKAKTGSGKTLAFGIPLLQRTMAARSTEPGRPRALVLVPTRELAVQVSEVLEPLAGEAGLRIAAVYGGADIERQIKKLRRGVDVIIATPGRLIDLGDRGELSVADIETLVLDEADRMADMGFMPQVEWVLRRLERDHQTLLFSATLDGPGHARGGLAQHHRRRHGAPLPRGAPDGPGQGVRRHLPELGEDTGVRTDQARRRPVG
jgi:superfamily II DNA/RNA helicase